MLQIPSALNNSHHRITGGSVQYGLSAAIDAAASGLRYRVADEFCLVGRTVQPVLDSPRLVLRPFQEGDALAVKRLAGDRRIADAATTIPHPYPDGAAEAWIAGHLPSFIAGIEITYAVVQREGALLVGTVSLLDISAKHARAELGYWTGVEFWGRGYCTEAVCRLIPFAYEHLGTTRVVARCLARNPASARVMEKAGLRREGYLAKHVFKNGKFEDVLLYGLVLPKRGE